MLDLELKLHREAVLANSEVGQKVFVLLRLRGGVQSKPVPVTNPLALAIAVDTSGSMYARLPGGTSKIERAIEAITSIGTLPDVGRNTNATLIQFDHRSAVLLPLSPLGEDGAERLAIQAARLRNYGGGTNLARALELVRSELGQSQVLGVKKAVVVTDGETTDEQECLALASQLSEEGISLICIGIGIDYNEDLLASLADRTSGFLYHLSESDMSLALLRQALGDVILKSRQELITDLRLSLRLQPEVSLVSANRVYPMVQALDCEQKGPWHLGNVPQGGEVDLVFEIDLPISNTGLYDAGEISLGYSVPSETNAGRTMRRALKIQYSDDPARAGRLHKDVIFFVRQARVSALANQAAEQTQQGRIEDAKRSIQLMQRLTHEVGNEAIAQVVRAAQMELARSATLGPEIVKVMKVGAKTKTMCAPPTKQNE